MNNAKESVRTLYSIVEVIKSYTITPFAYQLHDVLDYFYVRDTENPKYIQPCLSVLPTTRLVELKNANFLLISAAGATGKSALTEYLSYALHAPILNLSKFDTIASNSLTGMLMKQMEMRDCVQFMSDMKSGHGVIIIDALDEGLAKTTISGFEDFLKDVKSMSSNSGVSFILLGRTNVVEQTTLILEEWGCNVALLQIEPFSETQAEQFIDKQIENGRINVLNSVYRECRHLIIDSIKSFFANQTTLKNNQSSRFLGYAPVLMAIAEFLDKQNDFQKTKNDLLDLNKKDVALMVEIVRSIIKRDKLQKIDEVVIKPLLNGRSQEFVSFTMEKVYCEEEQCARTLYYVLGKQFTKDITGDPNFDNEYERKMEDWIKDHPFLDGHQFVNIVFEAYVLSVLIRSKNYEQDVMEYLKSRYKDSYILFYVFKETNDSEYISNIDFVMYLFASLKALDKRNGKCEMELYSTNCDDSAKYNCNLNFYVEGNNEGDEHHFKLIVSAHDTLSLLSDISCVHIDIPIAVRISSSKVYFTSPAYICATKINISADELFVYENKEGGNVVLECDSFEGISLNPTLTPKIFNYANPLSTLKLICSNVLSYPYCEYKSKKVQEYSVTPEIMERYNKCRKSILWFRGHSKGSLARYKEMIDNLVGNTPLGKSVLDALLKSGVIYEKSFMYHIDDEKMASVLGCKYDGIRAMEINESILNFLSNIKLN